MSSEMTPHSEEHRDRVFLYALQALPSSEFSEAEALISTCADCRRELESLRPIVESFAAWPTDVLRPSPSLWGRLAQRIADETGTERLLPPADLSTKPQWEDVAPGIHVKILSMDETRDTVSLLVRLDPGTDYPAHTHLGIEELHLLHGILKVDNRTLYPGDFIHAEAGTVDHRVWTETGCTCFLMTSAKDALL